MTKKLSSNATGKYKQPFIHEMAFMLLLIVPMSKR